MRRTDAKASIRIRAIGRSPRSKPTVSFCSEKFLISFAAAVLTFFIAGLLYLLCFEHVDNLGAYSIPSEAGLLIPSVNVNHELESHAPDPRCSTCICAFSFLEV